MSLEEGAVVEGGYSSTTLKGLSGVSMAAVWRVLLLLTKGCGSAAALMVMGTGS
jgi:hypothetical protein